ncbi:MAG: DUF1549 domain-containing protein [Verrucomicrobiota bacterium]|nr:DUF1549 domain-containing protein [Verrucomicrobiota bacterium]MDP7051777.1 DUF1549 domain-containing protein [Verrucomicrobiota bacterium]
MSGVLGIGLFGIQSAHCELAISSPGWGGGSLAQVSLTGSGARQQLLVTQSLGDGSVVDQTRRAALTAKPAGLVRITNGLVEPLANGLGVITARIETGETASIPFEVSAVTTEKPVNFANSIVPLFTKHGCNGGGCHGKSSGQNGFKLSLLGFEPQEDYEYLLREARGRRIFPAAPERSLLLLKSTGQLPHGGGSRINPDSFDYKAIVNWMRQGMPYGNPDDPRLESIEVHPPKRIMKPEASQQLVVLARMTDGSVEDITRSAVFEANDREYAETDNTGLVTAGNKPGEIVVMVRYQDKAAVFRALVPLGAPIESLPVERNFVDRFIFSKWKEVGMPPSEVAEDSTYLRRVTLDIVGRMPTVAEVEAFLDDAAPDKRQRLVERLLRSEQYAEYFANKWSALLRNKRANGAQLRSTLAFYDWIKESLYINKPYDRFVREIVAASGGIDQSPASAWFKQVSSQQAQMEDTAQLFLGTRLQCAQCHHHPFEKWSQDDYYRFMAFFSRVGKAPSGRPGEEIVFHRAGVAQVTNKKTKQPVKPAGLGGGEMNIAPADDPRHHLVDWMRKDSGRLFSKTLVNRYWKHFFGRGLVDPEDDFRSTNPATHPRLLDALVDYFEKTGYDLKALVRVIASSTTYQLSSVPNAYNAKDKHYYSRFQPKRLTAEVLYDSLNNLILARSDFGGLPVGTRAVCLPDNSYNSSNYFLSVFGRPDSSSACECERSQEASLAQSLHLFNAKSIHEQLARKDGRAARLAADKGRDHSSKINRLYFQAFARLPRDEEAGVALAYLTRKAVDKEGKPADKTKERYEDILWALANTKEFLFNH